MSQDAGFCAVSAAIGSRWDAAAAHRYKNLSSLKACSEGKGYAHCGQCAEFPCELLKQFAYDEKQGDGGKRIDQCRRWEESVV